MPRENLDNIPATIESHDYATVYEARSSEWSTTGLSAISANTHYEKTSWVAGEIVRLQCEMSGSEIRRRDNGVITIKHHLPSTENMSAGQRISNQFTKLLAHLVGESKVTTFRPLADSELSPKTIEQYKEQNELFAGIRIRRVSKSQGT
jgi:hypothetical protein